MIAQSILRLYDKFMTESLMLGPMVIEKISQFLYKMSEFVKFG